MDILKAEIERKKRLLEKNKDLLAPSKKYFKRGDLAARQEEEYWAKHQRLVKEPGKSEASDSHDSGDEHKKRDEDKGTKILPRKDVIRRLRERNEPITLFGESEQEAFDRLKKLEASEPDFNIGGGYANDFKAAMDQVDQDYFAEMMKSSSGSESQSTVSVKDDGTTKEDIEHMKEQLGKGDNDKDQEIILKYLKLVLKEWGTDINKKSDEDKRSLKGKVASAMHAQTVQYMKPMFRKLKHKSMQEDILECLVSIMGYMLEREYNKAHDAYLEMAIGNAAWPIGVTMVGIHARTGREKISSRYVAHVLNDETQRKYIQLVKKQISLVSYCWHEGSYRKVPKFSDPRKLCCNLPKIQTKSPNLRLFSQEDANGIANSEDPDQTAPLGAV